mgnify:CR=1 FL=1
MAKVELKQPVVQAIAEDVKDATSVVLVDYRGLTVAEDTEMRKQLREAGVVYKVCKNTMMKRAFEGTDFAALDEHLEGPSAIAISKDDATAPARILCKFAKNAKALELKAGVVEGTLYDADALNELAKIPSREELFPNYLEAYSHLSQTWPAFSIRSQKKVEQMLVKQLRQQKKLQKHQQLNRLMAA